MVISAFKQQRDFYDLSHTPYWFHKGPTLSNARFLFDETQYTTWLRNTAIVGVVVVLITLVLAIPAGYERRADYARAGGPGGLRARTAFGEARPERRRRHLPDVPRA